MQNQDSKFTIVGGGFGLYGYLPALVNAYGGRVLLPLKYKETIQARSELQKYEAFIDWTETKQYALNNANGIIIALPPILQHEFIPRIQAYKNIKRVLIEKPVAPTVEQAYLICNHSLLNERKVRIGYIFLYTEWYSLIIAKLKQPLSNISIYWSFEAHHISNAMDTWKRYGSKGGGVFRFYGIHLIAVLASLGYEIVDESTLVEPLLDQPEQWCARFSRQGLPEFHISLSIASRNHEFMIFCSDHSGRDFKVYQSTSPFEYRGLKQKQDIRIPLLEKIIKSFDDDDVTYYELYESTLALWGRVEEKSRIQTANIF